MTIYLVTSGEYSDYGIRAAFSTREAAETYIAEANKLPCADWAQVEEWPVDAEAGKVARSGWAARIVLETGDLKVEALETLRLASPRERSGFAYHWPGTQYVGEHYTVVSFVSAAHAGKLATEFRQKWLRERDQG